MSGSSISLLLDWVTSHLICKLPPCKVFCIFQFTFFGQSGSPIQIQVTYLSWFSVHFYFALCLLLSYSPLYSTPILTTSNLDFYFIFSLMPSKRKATGVPTSENINKAVRTSNSSDAPTSRKLGLCLITLTYSTFHVCYSWRNNHQWAISSDQSGSGWSRLPARESIEPYNRRPSS